MNPIGTRSGYSIPCIECVKNGLNRQSYIDSKGKEQEDSCGLLTSVVVAVYEVGIAVAGASKKSAVNVKWTPINQLRDATGELITEEDCLLVNFKISQSAAAKSSRSLSPTLHPDAQDAKVWKDFVQYVLTNKQYNKPDPKAALKWAYFPFLMEIWAAKPKEGSSQMVKSTPVFKVSDVEITGEQINGLTAHTQKTYLDEFVSNGGQLDNDGLPVLGSDITNLMSAEQYLKAKGMKSPALKSAEPSEAMKLMAGNPKEETTVDVESSSADEEPSVAAFFDAN
jgi:hypothetical protein